MDNKVAVGFAENEFRVSLPYFMNELVKAAPDRQWDRANKYWVLPFNEPNRAYVQRNFKPEWLSDKAKSALEEMHEGPDWGYWPEDWVWPVQPMTHQIEAVRAAWPHQEFALFHEMGLGKTYAAITLAQARWHYGLIEGLLVVCPTSIKTVWRHEFTKFANEDAPTSVHVHTAGGVAETLEFIENPGPLKVLVIGVESLSQGTAKELAHKFVQDHRSMVIVDESSDIKNWKAKRTEEAWKLGDSAICKLIMTGTSITQGIHDLYSQYRFLNWEIIGQKSFFTFRNRYCVVEPVPGQPKASRIVGYRNVDELMDLVRPRTHQRLKVDCLDLPDKVYEERIIEPTEDQKRLTRALKTTMRAELEEGKEVTVQIVLDLMLRWQQIAGGWMPVQEEDQYGNTWYELEPLKKNPKMDELLEVIQTIPRETKVIIWARFQHEIEEIAEAINGLDIGLAGMFYGPTPEQDRTRLTDLFQRHDNPLRFMVSNQAVGGMGQTWTAATVVVYYSDTFSYKDRVQSEDRAHRKGQTNKVTYIDLRMKLPIDRHIAKIIEMKGEMADYVKDSMKAILTED